MNALGVFVDGNELKLAYLKKTGKEIEIIRCEKLYLSDSKEMNHYSEKLDENAVSDIFTGLYEKSEQDATEVKNSADDSELFYNAFARYPDNELKIALNLQYNELSNVDLELPENLQNKQLRKKICAELQKYSSDIVDDQFDFIQTKDKHYTVFYLNDEISLLNTVLKYKQNTGSRATVNLVDMNESSLINLYNEVADDKSGGSILIYTGASFSRILFFENGRFVGFSQLINKGYGDEDLHSSIYGKLLFELHSMEIEDVRNIYTAGDGNLEELNEFLFKKLPDTVVSTLPVEQLIRRYPANNSFAEFAIPIAMAWKVLMRKEKVLVNTDLLPEAVKKMQGALRIAWHGYAAMLLLFVTTLSFVYFHGWYYEEKTDKEYEIELLDESLQVERKISEMLYEMDREISKYTDILGAIDSLGRFDGMYSDALRFFSGNVKSLNSLWLSDFNLNSETFSCSGMALYRSRIHRLADSAGNAVIQSMVEQEMRDVKLYSYNIAGFPGTFLNIARKHTTIDSIKVVKPILSESPNQ